LHLFVSYIFTLSLHDALPIYAVGVQKFDGIFDGDDVPVHVLVDVVQYRSKRRGLSASGGAGDQNETPGFMSYPLHHLWKDEILRSEEHTSELQSRVDIVCRLL